MAQSFPEYATAHADFIDQLAHATSAMLREAFDHAWTTLSATGALADFARLCNELDALEADAEARKEAGRPPKDVYRCVALPGHRPSSASRSLLAAGRCSENSVSS